MWFYIREKLISSFIKNVISTFSVQIIQLLFSIISTAVIARWLGPEGKGMIAMALLVPGMMIIFLNSGIGVANVYFVGSKYMDIKKLTSNSVFFTFIASIIGIIIVGSLWVLEFYRSLLPNIPDCLVLVAMVGLPVGVLNSYLISILQGLQSIMMINFVKLIQAAFMLMLTFIMVVIFEIGLLGALMAYIVTGILSLLLLILLIKKEGGIFLSKPNSLVIRSTLTFGLKGHIGNILQFFNYRADMFIVNYFLGPLNVGIYSISVAIAELLWHFPDAVGFVIFPKSASTKPEVMNTFTPGIFKITLGITALGAVILFFLGKPMITFIYSSSFLPSYIPMVVLLPGIVLLGSAKVLTNEIAGRGYPQYNSINAGIAFILIVILDLILIPRYGVIGAAMASSISYSVIFFLSIGFYSIVSRKKEGLSKPQFVVDKCDMSIPT